MDRLGLTRPPAMAAVDWIREGFRLFTPAVIPWMGMSAAFFLAAYGVSLIPMVGMLLLKLASPFLVAAYMAAARAVERGEPAGLIHVAAGWQRGRDALLAIGVVYMVAHVLIGQAMILIGGEASERLIELAARPQEMDPAEAQSVLNQALPTLLTGALLFTPLLMATWFAPALVLFNAFPAGKALYWSLWACLVNWRPLLLYGLILSLLALLALVIPLGLGLLLFMPLAMTSTYAAYRTQFVPRG